MPSRWELVLTDKMSGPAKNAMNAIGALSRSLGGLTGQLASLEKSLGGVGRGMNQMGRSGGGGSSAFAAIASGALSAARSVGSLGSELAQNVVELASFRESSLAALEAVSGSAEVAGRSFANAMVIANQTPGDTQDVIAMSQRLMVAGFSEAETTNLLGATSDIQAAFGNRQANSLALVFSQMRASGRMDRGDLRQLLNAGVNTGSVLDAIATQLNITGATERERRNKVLEALSKRRVEGDVGIQAALDSISGRLDHGGRLGSYAQRQSETLRGALSNARNAWDNLILGMDGSQIPGLVAFKDAVLAITRGFGAAAPAGIALRGILNDVMNSVGVGVFGGINDGSMESFAGVLQDVRPIIKSVVDSIMAFGSGFGSGFMTAVRPAIELLGQLSGDDTTAKWRDFGAVVGFVAGATVIAAGLIVGSVTGIYSSIASVPNTLHQLFDGTVAWFSSVPGQMVDGFVNGLRDNWARITDELRVLGADLPEPIRRALDMHSPSRVMWGLGEDTARGFELGVRDNAPRAGRAMEDLVTRPTSAIAGAFGAGGGFQLTIPVTVQAREGEEPEALGGRIGRGIASELRDLFATLNAGPAPAEA